MKIVIVAGVSSLGRRTRLAKFARVYGEEGLAVEHWAWLRTPDEVAFIADDLPEVPRAILIEGGGYANRRLMGWYLRWIVVVFVRLLKNRPTHVHALGLESALPAAVLRRFRPQMTLIYDDADRFSLCRPLSPRVAAVVAAVERWVSKQASVHVIPGLGRYPDGLPCTNTVTLRNFPSRDVLQAAGQLKPNGARTDSLLVYVNGWLGAERGSAMLVQTARILSTDESVVFVVAGRLTGSDAEELVRLPNVDYRGVLTNADSLALYMVADLVVTFYDPAIPINRWAEANKWGDCVATGTPFVVNSEVITASSFVDSGAAFAVGFGDAAALASLLGSLARDQEAVLRAKTAMNGWRNEMSYFDDEIRSEIVPRLMSIDEPA